MRGGPRRRARHRVGQRAARFPSASSRVLTATLRRDDYVKHIAAKFARVRHAIDGATEISDFHRIGDFGEASAKSRRELRVELQVRSQSRLFRGDVSAREFQRVPFAIDAVVAEDCRANGL